MSAVLAAFTHVEAVTSPISVTTFRANNGELITRSRSFTLTIAAKSSQGTIKTMRLGDSVSMALGTPQPYKTSVVYAFPSTATGRQVIAAEFQDSKGNYSGRINVTVQPTISIVGGIDTLLDFTVADVETPVESLVVTSSVSGVALPRGSVTIEGTGASRKLRMRPPVVTKPTPATISLTVTDGNRSRGTARVVVTVTP